jgi:hypothetical protein
MHLDAALSPSIAVPLPVNLLAITCDCGVKFAWLSSVSLAQCPFCGKQELWHDVDPKPSSGPWSERAMIADSNTGQV